MALINASEASGLVQRSERIIRGWILSGQLKAIHVPNGRWSISTADLARVKHLTKEDRDRIARFENGELGLVTEPVPEQQPEQD